MSGFSVSFLLTQTARIPTEFYSQILWELLLCPGLEPWAGEPLRGAKAPRSFRGVSTATRGCGDSLLHVSAPPTGLSVARFLYSQVYVL